MSSKMLILLLLVSVASAQVNPLVAASDKVPCDEEEKREATRKHSECIDQVQDRQQVASASRHPGSRLSALCTRLEEQVNKCGEHLGKCVTAADLRVIKDAQIDAFVKYLDAQRLSHYYQFCDIANEYIQSGRKPFKATEKCDLGEIEQVMKKNSGNRR